MVYLLALALILKNFQSSGENLKAVITSLVAFMRILTPSYYLAAAAAGGASSAVMFYQMLLLVILAVEKLLLALVLPMIHIYLCPNIFAGGLNFHGRYEFVPIQSERTGTWQASE